MWNEGTSFPIKAGHGCIGCSEDGFWDKGSFYDRLTNIHQFGVEGNADQIGGTAAGVVGAPWWRMPPCRPSSARQERSQLDHKSARTKA
jgi:Ni,Fe-hydrogenase I small subunit